MAANLTFEDIQTRVMNQLRLPTTNTAEAAKVAAVINEVYRDIAAKQDWAWLLKRGIINVTPLISGTATMSKGSVSGAFDAIPQQNGGNVSVAGFLLSPATTTEDQQAMYRIATHVSGDLDFTLDAGYTNESGSTTVKLYQDSYALPADAGKIIHVRRFGGGVPMNRTGVEEMNWLRLANRLEAPPDSYAIFDHATTGDPTSQRMIQFYPLPDTNYHRVEILYKMTLNTEMSGATRPHIPDDYSQIMIYGSLARAYPIFMNDPDRGRYFQQLFNDVLALMSAQQKEYAKDNSGVAPANAWRRSNSYRNGTLRSRFETHPYNP